MCSISAFGRRGAANAPKDNQQFGVVAQAEVSHRLFLRQRTVGNRPQNSPRPARPLPRSHTPQLDDAHHR
jgi:hypothetical protein